MSQGRHPPYSITANILNAVAEISEFLGRWSASHQDALSPQLRRENRIRTIQASFAIEHNSLSLEHFTAILEGKLDKKRALAGLLKVAFSWVSVHKYA